MSFCVTSGKKMQLVSALSGVILFANKGEVDRGLETVLTGVEGPGVFRGLSS